MCHPCHIFLTAPIDRHRSPLRTMTSATCNTDAAVPHACGHTCEHGHGTSQCIGAKRKHRLNELMGLLDHASKCAHPSCASVNCRKMKVRVLHVANTIIRKRPLLHPTADVESGTSPPLCTCPRMRHLSRHVPIRSAGSLPRHTSAHISLFTPHLVSCPPNNSTEPPRPRLRVSSDVGRWLPRLPTVPVTLLRQAPSCYHALERNVATPFSC